MLTRRVSLPKFLTGAGASSASPSSERSAHNSSSSDLSSSLALSSTASDDPQKECAIKVVIRARPLSDRELLAKTPVIVNVTRSSIQVINPVVFLDPTYLEAISSPSKRVTQRDLPVALSAQGISAAVAAGECRTFHFDRCFGVDNAAANETEPFAASYDIDFVTQRPNQELIFDEIGRDMIESAFQGFNCTVLAYGQTGSGKTHTMVGEKTTKGKGLIPRVCEALFTAIDARRAKEGSEPGLEDDKSMDTTTKKSTLYSAQVSYCEIYKEKVNDLLDSSGLGGDTTAAGKAKSPPGSPSWNGGGGDDSFGSSGSSSVRRTLRVREHPTTGPFVEGLSSRPVTCYADIVEEMLAGEKLRTVASTLVNPVSSRSHAVFTITFTQTTFDAATQTAHDKTSKISMIDLAGSERANASGTSGDRLKEGAMINKSLTTLGRVISALSKQGGERVPYRDSTLTWLLKESLGGNAKTTMIAMVSPSSDSYDETMSTLRYAESAKRVINRAVVNEDKNARIIRQLRQEIQELRVELEMAKLSPKKRSTSDAGAVISASITECDEFQSQLLQELEQLRSLQAQNSLVASSSDVSTTASPDPNGGCTHVHKTLPSLLVDVTKRFKPGSALVYTLHEGKTVFGSGMGLDVGSSSGGGDPEAQEKKLQLTIDTSSDDLKENESSSPPTFTKQRSWSPTFLRRRSFSSSAAANTGNADSTSPRKLEKRGSGSLTKRKSGSSTIAKPPPSEVSELKFYLLPASNSNDSDIAARHVQITCAKVPSTADDDGGTPCYCIEVEPLDANTRVLLNGKPLSAVDSSRRGGAGAHRVEMRHGDRLQLGDAHYFSLYVPQVALLAGGNISAAVEGSKKSVESLEDLVAVANKICSKWNLHMEFALKRNDDASGSEEEDEENACVVVKKHLDGQRYSVVEWKRPMLGAKVAFLRQFDESFEDSGTILAFEQDLTIGQAECDDPRARPSMETIASHRKPDAASEGANDEDREETKGPEVAPSPPHHLSSSSSSLEVSPPSIASSSRGHRPTPGCIRLIGQGRIFMPPLKSYANGPMIAAVYDGAGHSIGKLYMHLQYTTVPTNSGSGSGEKHSERRPSLLARSASLLAMTLSLTSSSSASRANSTAKSTATASMRIHLDKIVFDVSQSMATDGVSLTLKKWSNLSSSGGDKKKTSNGSEVTSGSGTNFSTPKILPLANERATATYAPLKIFQIIKMFETRLSFGGDGQAAKFTSNAEKTASSGESTTQDDFVAFEVWGYGQLGVPQAMTSSQIPQQPTRKIDFYVSVDIDEREQDGIFRPVAVKADGALRLHANQPRRLNVRVTQADQQQFALCSIAAVQISPSFRTNCDTASLSAIPGGNKSSQWLLSPSSATTSRAQSLRQTSEPGVETSEDTWRTLEFRNPSEQNASSRSLSASLKWDRDASLVQNLESADDEGTRSVFRVVVAVTTAWSSVPIVVSKSVVTKVSPSVVTAKLKLMRELETSRMAWWARESFSREYRLGTWYTADVVLTTATGKDSTEDYEGTVETEEAEDQGDREAKILNFVVNSHVRGLLRLEVVLELEHLRQQVLKMIPFSTTETVNKEVLSAREKSEELTFDKVTEALSTLFENGDDQEQKFEILQLQNSSSSSSYNSKQQLFLRKKTRRDLLVGVKYGNVMDLSSSARGDDAQAREDDSFTRGLYCCLHSAHFVTEPSHLASGSGGFEMSGFLMLSTAFQLDEAAITSLSASASAATASGPGSGSTRLEKPAKPVKANWERRWFVLKRPFLYVYKTFALKEEVGVLDISKCQLLTSPSPLSSSVDDGHSSGWHHSSSSISHSSHSSASASSSSSPSGRAKAQSSQVLASIPFSFQLVCLVGAKCVVWTLQASTSPEKRAWLVAIDPLKIEAREAVVSSQSSSIETPMVTA